MVPVKLTCGLLLNYCILEMKADNEPTISLPVYFFLRKKQQQKEQKNQNKTKIKFPTARVQPRPGPLTWKVSALPIAPRQLVNK